MAFNPDAGLDEPGYGVGMPAMTPEQATMAHGPTDGAAAQDALAMNTLAPGGAGDPISAQFAQQDAVDTLPDRPAPATEAPVAPAMSAPVATAPKRVGGGGPSQGALTKNETDARAKADTAEAAQADAVKAEAKVAAQQAEANKIQAEHEAQVIDVANAASEKRLGAASALLQQKADAASKMRVRGMYDNPDGSKSGVNASEVGAALMAGLGAFASAMTGGPNTALQVINDNQQRFRQKQLDAISQAHQGVADQKDILSNARIEIAAKEEGMYKKLAAERMANQLKFGADKETAAGDTLYQGLLAKSAEKKAEWQGELIKRDDELKTHAVSRALMGSQIRENDAQARDKDAQAKGGGKATESEKKYAILGQGLLGELDTIAKNPTISSAVLDTMQKQASSAAGAEKTAASGVVGSWFINKARDKGAVPRSKYDGLKPQDQVIANAWDNAIEKYARVLTGAGMPVEEAQRMALQDAPHAGDSKATIAQKYARMKAAANGIMSQSGSAGAVMAPAAPGAGPTSARATTAQMAEAQAWLKKHPEDKVADAWVRQQQAAR